MTAAASSQLRTATHFDPKAPRRERMCQVVVALSEPVFDLQGRRLPTVFRRTGGYIPVSEIPVASSALRSVRPVVNGGPTLQRPTATSSIKFLEKIQRPIDLEATRQSSPIIERMHEAEHRNKHDDSDSWKNRRSRRQWQRHPHRLTASAERDITSARMKSAA